MVNVKVEKKAVRAKGSKGDNLNSLRAGRLSNEQRLLILNEIGMRARKMYNKYVTKNTHGYNLDLLKDALQFEPDVAAFENIYWVDTGDTKLNAIASYFENGTGIHNVKYKKSDRSRITSKSGKAMVFRKPWNGIKGATSVAGVRPLYMLRRTLKNIEFNRAYIQREIRFKLGI